MNASLKIGLLAISVVAISLFATYYIVSSYQFLYLARPNEINFYKSHFDQSKKIIFMIGSSQMWRVNMVSINMEISKSCPDCIVYNLAESADNPSNRIKTLPYLISLHPKLVIYGIGYRDFSGVNSQDDNVITLQSPQNTILPDLQSFFHAEFKNQVDTDINPKLFTLNVLSGIVKHDSNTTNENVSSYMPFRFGITKDQFDSYDNEGLVKNDISLSEIPLLAKIDPHSLEVNAGSLEEIIGKMQKNKIKVTLIIVPHSKVFLDQVPDNDKRIFNSTIERIATGSGVDVYDLDKKFENMTIWSDPWHVTLNSNGTVYSKEMINIILKELA